MSTLFIVATPIGNLDDITIRALAVLAEVPLIAAEDTRTTRKLLNRHNVPAPRLLSYTDRNRRSRTPQILAALEDGNVALVSEAGMPGISDPGVHLVNAATEARHRVEPIPGASALTAALAASGLPTRRVLYLGFLPRTGGPRRRALREVADSRATLIAFEAPHRLRAALSDLLMVLGDRKLAVCRELTKLHEEIFRGLVSDAIDHFTTPRGEFTLVIEGAEAKSKPEDLSDVDQQLRELKASGERARAAVKEVAQRTGVSHQAVYRRWLALSGASDSDTPTSQLRPVVE